jgi:rubredoxin
MNELKPPTDKFILNAAGDPVPCDDLLTWARWFEDGGGASRTVATDDIGGSRVSTVFLALDHSFGHGLPVLWETMVFGGPLDGEMARYTSKGDALAGHQAMCVRVVADQVVTKGVGFARVGERDGELDIRRISEDTICPRCAFRAVEPSDYFSRERDGQWQCPACGHLFDDPPPPE